MENMNNLTLLEKKLNNGEIHCESCNVGYYKPFNPKYKVNHYFICDKCGATLMVEPNVIIE